MEISTAKSHASSKLHKAKKDVSLFRAKEHLTTFNESLNGHDSTVTRLSHDIFAFHFILAVKLGSHKPDHVINVHIDASGTKGVRVQWSLC